MVQEQLVRNIQFFGQESQDKICNSFIIIFGVGGIGRYIEPNPNKAIFLVMFYLQLSAQGLRKLELLILVI